MTTETSFLSETVVSDYSSSYFDLGLGENGLRIGHWNVDYLTTTKFEQIKLFLLGNMRSGRSQLDALFISETFLKPDDPDTCYAIPGFIIHRRDRKTNGGGIMALISRDLTAKRRNDLESAEVEAIWLEVCPYKSKRSIILGSFYRPPSSKKDDDIKIEELIERVHLLNKETIIVSDINIDYKDRKNYVKHRLAKGLHGMNFKQLVDFITRPVSKTCLDHVYCNQPQRINLVTSADIGLADHLPVFVVRKYARENLNRQSSRDMKLP